jgi:4'-phosphopantetheinyl transferase
MGAAERRRWGAFARAARREQYRLGRWLLRLALTEAVGGAPQDWRLNAAGPPAAVHARGWRAPWLSLSHSGPWFAVALEPRGPVGVDIEWRRQHRDWRALAGYQGWRLGRHPKADFLRRWCAFEAAYKAGQSRWGRNKDAAFCGWGFETPALYGHWIGPPGPPPTPRWFVS